MRRKPGRPSLTKETHLTPPLATTSAGGLSGVPVRAPVRVLRGGSWVDSLSKPHPQNLLAGKSTPGRYTAVAPNGVMFVDKLRSGCVVTGGRNTLLRK